MTGHPYESTLYTEKRELPQWITEEGNGQLEELSAKLSAALTKDGARLLLDPVCVRKI